MSVNIFDFIAFPFFLVATAISLGLIDAVWFGFDMSTVLIDLGSGHYLTYASALSLVALLWVALTNDWDNSNLNGVQLWVVVVTFALVLAPPLFPVLVETIAETPAAVVAFIIQAGGFFTFSWLG